MQERLNTDTKIEEVVHRIAAQVKKNSKYISLANEDIKNSLLERIAKNIEKHKEKILSANEIDINTSKNEPTITKAFLDRLTLNEKRLTDIIKGVVEIISLKDPVGEVVSEWQTKDGLKIKKMRVPIGVIGIIYEARPNVTIDAAALCLKSGNAVILRGGKEAKNTNTVLVDILKRSLIETNLPPEIIEFLSPDLGYEAVHIMTKLNQYIDLIIPRGSEEMIRKIQEISTIPILAHGKGNCHIYVDKDANINLAVKVCFNAKVQRPGVCNAMETLLVHKECAGVFLPQIGEKYRNSSVEIRGCEITQKILPYAKPATEDDWYREYLDLIIAIKVVSSLEEAIEHINKYGSGHTEAIITENKENAEKFLKEVDSSCVLWNASTRLHDGGVFGLGAEIGISTQKLHARGTMGLRELTTTKYVVYGSGQIRE
jgi:glutamate-5-semialdehyde dehydrogenase